MSKAREYAAKEHASVNQKYDGQPYMIHIDLAAKVGEKYIDLIPAAEQQDVMAGIYVHDVLEDTHASYNDLKRSLGFIVAEYSYALQNEKGRVRGDRANDKYYQGIKAYKHAVFVKLCDRYANTAYSKQSGSSMFKKYKSEFKEFQSKLWDGRYQELWNELEQLYD
jgi:(p)ppGpp synthase/HD superfamily hydrolase